MKVSAGLLPYRMGDRLEVLIAHPGGPLWAKKEEGAWSVVKGELSEGEDPEVAARREFEEETGWQVPAGASLEPLGEVVQRSGKRVMAWAVAADFDPADLRPGTFETRWLGSTRRFPEIDRVEWCSSEEAGRLLNPAQVPFLDRLAAMVAEGGP